MLLRSRRLPMSRRFTSLGAAATLAAAALCAPGAGSVSAAPFPVTYELTNLSDQVLTLVHARIGTAAPCRINPNQGSLDCPATNSKDISGTVSRTVVDNGETSVVIILIDTQNQPDSIELTFDIPGKGSVRLYTTASTGGCRVLATKDYQCRLTSGLFEYAVTNV